MDGALGVWSGRGSFVIKFMKEAFRGLSVNGPFGVETRKGQIGGKDSASRQ